MTTKQLLIISVTAFAIGYAFGTYSKKKTELIQLSIDELNEKMKTFISSEDYESAAIVRDVIKAKQSAA